MPRSWSEAVKACKQHPSGLAGKDGKRRACSCKVGWRYRMGVPDPITGRTGKPEWSQTFPTKQAADNHQIETRKAIAEGTYTNDRGKTLAMHLPEWLERLEVKGRKASTVTNYRRLVEVRIIPELGHHRLGRLTQHHVQAWLDKVAREPQMGKGRTGSVTAGTLVNLRAVLRASLNDALRRGLVARNVAELVELPEVKRPAPVAIETTRLARWLAHVENDRLAALWLCVAVYGPRRGELLGLRWDDVDVTGHLIRVTQELIDVDGEHLCRYCEGMHQRLLFDTPKSAAGERVWPLVPEVEAALIAHQLAQVSDQEAFGDGYSDHGLVFACPDGMPLRPDWISREFKRTFKASGATEGMAKVPSIKALRSTSVTALHEAGVSLEVIQRVAGHAAHSDVTRDHYLAVSAERVRPEFSAIAAQLSAGGRSGRSDPQSGRETGLASAGGNSDAG